MLTLRGAPALSAFRLDKLTQKLSAIHPEIKLLHTEYVHFADLAGDLAPERQSVLEQLLDYGPSIDESGHVSEGEQDQLLLVTPRPGMCHRLRQGGVFLRMQLCQVNPVVLA